ncbi:LysM peptidoglycan-binding domain-containing protein [Pseudooceanicola aestuarii]|uniref:LysM peptidoglycan-binding domain-containing protein n=1 Tax=Pseudooceanicola aestuarii TaxID=2697319 RepID=UPI001EF759B4|nr:LysM peptidoglycan-binding domain-containing protein [Pseudooceanicola aestuarii]
MKLASLGGWPGVVAGVTILAAGVASAAWYTGYLPGRVAGSATAPEKTERAALPQGQGPARAPVAGAPAGAASETGGKGAADTEPAPVPEATSAPAPDADALPETPVPPRFDIVRVEPDGTTLVAGRAAARWPVAVMLDGSEMGRQTAGSDGKFVAFLELPASDRPRVMTLVMYGPEGEGEVASSDQVILAPASPVAVAATSGAEAAPQAVTRVAGTTRAPAATEAPDQIAALAPAPETPQTPDKTRQREITQDPDIAPSTTPAAPPASETARATAAVTGGMAQGTDRIETSDGIEDSETSDLSVTIETSDTTGVAETADPSVAAGVADMSGSSDATIPQAATTSAQAEDRPQVILTAPVATAAPTEIAAPTAVAGTAQRTPVTEATPPASSNVTPDAPAAADPQKTPAADTAPAPEPRPGMTVLLANEDGVQVLQRGAPTPETSENVALDTITYSSAGDVLLAGRGTSGAFVRIYLDDRPAATLSVDARGNWRTDLPNVDTGVYRLRVDEVDAQGVVQSRVETPFERVEEDIAAEAVATPRISQITVQPGNTLWAIARDTYGEGTLYVSVYEANKDLIRNPDLIYPGQIFAMPARD